MNSVRNAHMLYESLSFTMYVCKLLSCSHYFQRRIRIYICPLQAFLLCSSGSVDSCACIAFGFWGAISEWSRSPSESISSTRTGRSKMRRWQTFCDPGSRDAPDAETWPDAATFVRQFNSPSRAARNSYDVAHRIWMPHDEAITGFMCIWEININASIQRGTHHVFDKETPNFVQGLDFWIFLKEKLRAPDENNE